MNSQSDPPAAPWRDWGETAPAGPQHALIVDSSPDDARRVEGSLNRIDGAAATCTVAATLAEAEALLRAGHPFTIALLAPTLPEGGPAQCLRRIRGVDPDLPVIVLVGETDEPAAQRLLELGAQDCLPVSEISPGPLQRAMRYAHSRARLVSRLNCQDRALAQARAESEARAAGHTPELARLNRAHRALSAANHAVLRATSERALLREVCRVITDIAGYALAWVGLQRKDAARSVVIAASAGSETDYLNDLQVSWDADSPRGGGPVGTCLRTGRTTVVNNIEADESFSPWREKARGHGFRSVVGIPLFNDGKTWASLAIYAAEANAFDPEEVNLLKELGADLSFGVMMMRIRNHHQEALRELAEREETLNGLVETAPTLIAMTDTGGTVQLFNSACERLTGHYAEDVVGKNLIELFVDGTERGQARALLSQIGVGALRTHEFHWITKSRQQRLIEWRFTALDRTDGTRSIIQIGVDVTERRRHEQQMQKLSSAIENAAEIVMITNAKGTIEYVNPAFEENTGYTFNQAIGRKPSILKSGLQDEAFYTTLWERLLAGERFSSTFMNRRKNGELFYEDKTITPLKDPEGTVTHFIATGRNITKERSAEERIHQLSSYDPLTQLPNRALFLDRLKHATAQSPIREHQTAVLVLNIDRFKIINETLGHELGDQLIRRVAERLARCVRGGDTLARLGGDEFAVLMPDIDSVDSVAPFAQRILDALEPPFKLNNEEELFVTGSMGIGLFPADASEAGELLICANAAIQQAKTRGQNRYQFYTADINTRSSERLSLETNLRRALERNEFVLHYQPQIDIVSGTVEAVEALIRWEHPELGLVSPGEFIPLLEETGLIVPVGEWVLFEAARQHIRWARQGHPPLEVAVNLSAIQLQQENLVDTVAGALADSGMEAKYLELEITESSVMERMREAVELLQQFKSMGIRLTVDDFGTGYSSLSYLTRLPIDTLKVDRSFVSKVTETENDAEVTQAVVALAHALRLTVVAEGIETEEQLRFLRSIGSHRAQGYLFSRPVPADRIPGLIGKPLIA